MFLDSSVHTLYASQPVPTKVKHRARKRPDSEYALELEKLLSADEPSVQKSEVEGCSDSNLNADQAGCLEAKLERELANFMRTRQRK